MMQILIYRLSDIKKILWLPKKTAGLGAGGTAGGFPDSTV